MRATVERILSELQIDGLDGHRLREVETILRLLMRHLNRSVADALNRLGRVTALEQASDSLRRMRESMMWVEANRQEGDERTIQRYLMKAAQAGSEVVASIESL
jgi:predicted metal-dependent enzyme (double-stranded beta helix superfamily)